MKPKRIFLLLAPVALITGLGSCAASVILPNPSPNDDESIVNGMHDWKKARKTFDLPSKPDWCLSQSVLGDGEYSELNCYFPTRRLKQQYEYRIVHCIFDTQDFPSRCSELPRTETFSRYEVGKWTRFYGELSPSPVENKLIQMKSWSLVAGALLIFLAAPVMGATWCLWSILSNDWSL